MTDHIVGYGSLLSAYSRRTYSGLDVPVIPVIAEGWRRGWTTRYRDELATYAGVRREPGAHLSAALVPAEVTEELRHRERGYIFDEVDRATLHTLHGQGLPGGRFWIVKNLEQILADDEHPIPQTYVDTCLIGCLETGGEAMARDFIRTMELWDGHWVDDRDSAEPLYPRRTPADAESRDRIDRLLGAEGVLHLRHDI